MADVPRTIRVACSPDADDLFMMRALDQGLIDPGPFRWEIRTASTDTLNRLGAADDVEVLAISTAWYPRLADRWQMLPHGGSMGEGYGPVVVAPQAVSLDALRGRRIAVPGTSTTAYHVLRMMLDRFEPVEIPIEPYALVFDALRADDVDAALIIHEGRLTFQAEGFAEVAELGRWWEAETGGLPLPLGANSIRRDLGPEVIAAVSDRLRASIAHGLAHRDAAIDDLLARGGALRTREALDRYLSMYANDRTLDYGPEGRAGVEAFFARGAGAGLFRPAVVDWAP